MAVNIRTGFQPEVDGEPIGATGKRYDVFLRDIKELRGIGGSLGKGIRIVYTKDDIKSACEDVNTYWVIILDGTYTFGTSPAITPTQYTRISAAGAVGDVKFDWNGSTWGVLFNLSATFIQLERLMFVSTGNVYHAWSGGSYHRFIDCWLYGSNAQVTGSGDSSYLERCRIGSNHYVDDDYLTYSDCYFYGTKLAIRSGKGTKFSDCHVAVTTLVQIYCNTAYPTDRDTTFDVCTWRGTQSVACISFARGNASTVRNIKFLGCIFEPLNNTIPCIRIGDYADVTVEDLLFDGCTFRDALDAYQIPNGIQNRWRFNNNIYTSIANRIYNFPGGTQNDFEFDDMHRRKATAVSYTVNERDKIIAVTDTAAPRTITFPTTMITKMANTKWTVKDESGGAAANNITIATQGAETIDGAASIAISTNYGKVELYSDGVNLFTC